MSWTKRQLVVQAFEQIGLASYVFDLPAEQLASSLRQLDAMLAVWNARGLRLGYPLPSTAGGSTLDESSNIPDSAIEAVVSNLALRLAPGVGKTVSPELKIVAKQGYDVLLARAAIPPEIQMPVGTPAGAGNKGQTALNDPDSNLAAGADSELEFD